MPVYNIERRLARSAASVFAQSFEDWELIFVDDGSTDSSGPLCDELAASDARVSALHKENGGLSDARNAGIRAARGDYLLFLDGDDELLPGALARAAARLEKGPELLTGRLRAVNEADGTLLYGADFHPNEAVLNSGDREAALSELKRARMSPSACRWAVRRGFLFESSLFFEKGLLNEDALWTPRLLAAASSLAYEPEPFYLYYIRENSIMTSRSFKRAQDALCIAERNLSLSRSLTGAARELCLSLTSLMLCSSLADWGGFGEGERAIIKAWYNKNRAAVLEILSAQRTFALAARLCGLPDGLLALNRAIGFKNWLFRPRAAANKRFEG
ncbi:MAG: glycosyltransferase [Oscillospiraceae bacterium]|nr:glycosyltransferase [Oscillospiraceae bacterium]